jgi:hypothetical protein
MLSFCKLVLLLVPFTVFAAKYANPTAIFSLIAPAEWVNSTFTIIPESKDHRSLRNSEYYYRKSQTPVGYVVIDTYSDSVGSQSICQPAYQGTTLGLKVGSCIVAHNLHDASVALGSLKIGLVTSSTQKTHIHIEVYNTTDCTGRARRSVNPLGRLHFVDDAPIAHISNPRSRHFLATSGVSCFKLRYSAGTAAPIDSNCLTGAANIYGHGLSATCASSDFLIYAVYPTASCATTVPSCNLLGAVQGGTDDYGGVPEASILTRGSSSYDPLKAFIFTPESSIGGASVEQSTLSVYGRCRTGPSDTCV